MRFPSNPVNEDIYIKNNIKYIYNSDSQIWTESGAVKEIPEFEIFKEYQKGSIIKKKDDVLIAKRDIEAGIFNITDWRRGDLSYRVKNAPCAKITKDLYIDFNQTFKFINDVFVIEMMIKNNSEESSIIHTHLTPNPLDKSLFGVFYADNTVYTHNVFCVILIGENASSLSEHIKWVIPNNYINQWIHLKVELINSDPIQCNVLVNNKKQELTQTGATSGAINPKGYLVSGRKIDLPSEGFFLDNCDHEMYNVRINDSFYPLQDDAENKTKLIDGTVTSYDVFSGIQNTHSAFDSYGGSELPGYTRVFNYSIFSQLTNETINSIEENNKYIAFGTSHDSTPRIFVYKKSNKYDNENSSLYLGSITHNNNSIHGMAWMGEDSDYLFFTSASDNTSDHKRAMLHVKSDNGLEVLNTTSIGFGHYAGPVFYLGNGIFESGQARDGVKIWVHDGNGGFLNIYTHSYVSSAGNEIIYTVGAAKNIIIARRYDRTLIYTFYVNTETFTVYAPNSITTDTNLFTGFAYCNGLFFLTDTEKIYVYELLGENETAYLNEINTFITPNSRRIKDKAIYDPKNEKIYILIEDQGGGNSYRLREIEYNFETNEFGSISTEVEDESYYIESDDSSITEGCFVDKNAKKIYYSNNYKEKRLRSARANEECDLLPNFNEIQTPYRKSSLLKNNTINYNVTKVYDENYTIQPEDVIIHTINDNYNPMIINIPLSEVYTGRILFIKDGNMTAPTVPIRIQTPENVMINGLPFYDITEMGKNVGIYCEEDNFYFM